MAAGLGNRIGPPRYLAFIAVALAAGLAWWWLGPGSGWKDAATIGFDLGALVFLASVLPLLRDSDARTIRRHARQNDANRAMILIVTAAVTLVVMIGIADELPAAKEGILLAIARLVGTLVLTWLFANTVYALHYAHLYYAQVGGRDAGGLDFPGTPEPRYGDFAYFAFTLGMTFQTSDVSITARAMRRVALLHSAAAFVFNIGVIAFTINAIGGK